LCFPGFEKTRSRTISQPSPFPDLRDCEQRPPFSPASFWAHPAKNPSRANFSQIYVALKRKI
jgi:hypothetical protein